MKQNSYFVPSAQIQEFLGVSKGQVSKLKRQGHLPKKPTMEDVKKAKKWIK